MSGLDGCYGCNTTSSYNCGPACNSGSERSWLLPALLIFAALLLSGSLNWLLILLGIILLFGKELLEIIF